MIVALIISLVLDGAWLVHFVAHHRTGIAMAAVGAVGWLGARTGIPLLASHTGRHVGKPPRTKPEGIAA